MIGSWKEADSKLKEIFSNKQIHGKIRGALLNKSEEEHLNYFVGDNEEIGFTLSTLLQGKLLL